MYQFTNRYGQTGSGKTYTMMGTEAQPGVNRRAIRELLKLIKTSTDLEVEMEGSIMEVYNENLYVKKGEKNSPPAFR